MGEPSDTQGYPVEDHIQLGSENSILLYPTAARESPINTEYSNLDLQFLQDPLSQSNPRTSPCTLGESSFQMHEELSRNLEKRPNISQSHIVPPGISNESSLQGYPVPGSQLSYQISPGPLAPTGTPVPSSHQWPAVPTSKLNQQMSQNRLLTTESPMQLNLQRQPVCESKLSHQIFQSSLVPTGTSMQSSLQGHLDPTSKLSQQMSYSSLVPARNPMPLSLQRHQIPTSHQQYQMSQNLAAEPTSTQSNPQCHPYFNRYLGPQVSPGPSTETNPCTFPDYLKNPCLLPSGAHPVSPSPELPSSSSGNYGFDHSQESLEPLDTNNQEVPPRSLKKKKIRLVYSRKQKLLLEGYFKTCREPKVKMRTELANEIGVTQEQIQTWFKNRRAKDKRKKPQDAPGVPETGESSKAVSGSTSYHGDLSVCSSVSEESVFPAATAYHDQPERNDATPGPAVASAEIPTPTVAAAQETGNSQHSSPSAEELWKRVLEDLEALEDW